MTSVTHVEKKEGSDADLLDALSLFASTHEPEVAENANASQAAGTEAFHGIAIIPMGISRP